MTIHLFLIEEAVDLAIGIALQLLQMVEGGRNHVFGQHLSNLHPELRSRDLLFRLIEECYLLLGLVIDDAAILYELARGGGFENASAN